MMRSVPRNPLTFALTRLLWREASISYHVARGDAAGVGQAQDLALDGRGGERLGGIKQRGDEDGTDRHGEHHERDGHHGSPDVPRAREAANHRE